MLTKEQWAEIEKKLEGIYASVDLLIDGFKVCLQVQRLTVRTFAIVIFVDGKITGDNICCGEPTDIARRFYFQEKRFLYGKKYRDEAQQKLRARLGKDMKEFFKTLFKDYDRQLVSYVPFWSSFPALRRHLIRNNQSIELAPEEKAHGHAPLQEAVDVEAKVG